MLAGSRQLDELCDVRRLLSWDEVRLWAERTGAKQPHGNGSEQCPVMLGELARRLEPAAHIDRASQHDRVVAGKIGELVAR
jgi:hypothetical protein